MMVRIPLLRPPESVAMASLLTGFGAPVAHAGYRTEAGDFVVPAGQISRRGRARTGCLSRSRQSPSRRSLNLEKHAPLCGLKPRTLRNLLHARDAILLASRLPGKGYRFDRAKFLKWVESRPDYARLPGVKEARRKKANREALRGYFTNRCRTN